MENRPIQLRQSDIGKEKVPVYSFNAFTVIWLDTGGQVTTQRDFDADKLGREKIRGLQGFRMRTSVLVYNRRNQWIVHAGELFGAYLRSAHRKTLTL